MTKAIFTAMGAAVALLAFRSPAFALADDAAKVERGKRAYNAQRCHVCHSIEGQGQPA